MPFINNSMKSFFLMTIPMLILAGCGGSGENPVELAEIELEELMVQVKTLEDKRNQLRKERSATKAKVPKKSTRSKVPGEKTESMIEAEKYLASLEDGVATIDSQIEQWRAPLRKSFEGAPFSGLTLANNEVIPRLKIVEVDDYAIRIEVDGSEQQLRWSEISEKSRIALLHEKTVLGAKKQ